MNTTKHMLAIDDSTPMPMWTSRSSRSGDSTFHQIAPYIGRMKTTMARSLINEFTEFGDLILDPFCGCGVVPLESAISGRRVIAGDINPYAVLLTKAKLFPPQNLQSAEIRLENAWTLSREKQKEQDLRKVPIRIRRFFHPETLRDALAFRDACVEIGDDFLLACLLGILHHQRPGFLSYPCSNLVPYLRDRKFPQHQFPDLYERRDVLIRLQAKLRRTFRRPPNKYPETRQVLQIDAREFPRIQSVKAVITSPPYMNELDYVRDNRLRLWFIQRSKPDLVDISARNRRSVFTDLMKNTCIRLAPSIELGGYFVLVVGNLTRGERIIDSTAALMQNLFETEPALQCFQLVQNYDDIIPDVRRSRSEYRGTKTETILVYKKIQRSKIHE